MTLQKINSKKGIFFTFAAIGLAIIIMLSFNVYNYYGLKDKMEVIEIRVNTMNDFVKDLEDDIGNAIFISGFRSLLSLEDYLMKYNAAPGPPARFLDDLSTSLNVAFSEAFRLGTITGELGIPEKIGIMDNNTFINWTTRMKEQANKTDISVDFTVNSITISQSEPWMVDVAVNLDIDIKDNKNTASWAINSKTYTKKINITGFVDPLYLVNNNGLVNNTMKVTTVDPSASSSNLNTHLINSYYIQHSDAPSYLMRFENNLGSSSYGIESLVNSQERIDAGLSALSRSAVDYIYFGTGVATDCKVMDPSYDWFRLDTPDHIGFYGAVCV